MKIRLEQIEYFLSYVNTIIIVPLILLISCVIVYKLYENKTKVDFFIKLISFNEKSNILKINISYKANVTVLISNVKNAEIIQLYPENLDKWFLELKVNQKNFDQSEIKTFINPSKKINKINTITHMLPLLISYLYCKNKNINDKYKTMKKVIICPIMEEINI